MTSGRYSDASRASPSSRSRTELMFQEAIRTSCPSRPEFLWLAERDVHRADAVDARLKTAAAVDLCHAFRGAGDDQVAGLQLDQTGKIGDRLWHVPDHGVDVAVLTYFAVDLEDDPRVARVPDLARRPDRPARSGIVEALAHVPRPGELLRLVLQIAPGEIDADRISIDMVERAALRDVAPARLQRHHQLDLVMEILGGAGKRHRRAVFHHGVAGLGEKERRLPVRIAPHL